MSQFDMGREIELTIPGPEDRSIVVRFPTDQEWIERQKAQKTLVQQIGRGVTETRTMDSDEADAALVDKIRLDRDNGPAIDAAESALVLSRLSRVKAGDPVRDGANYQIPLQVPGAKTLHVLRVPWTREVNVYRRAASQQRQLKHGVQEIRVNLQPAAELYDTLLQRTEGYASAVPIIHKAAVMLTLLQEIDALVEGAEDEDF